MNNKGKSAEIQASKFLRKKGYKIVDVNYHSRFGEIDIIAEKDGCIVFVEVKMRSEDSIVKAYEAVDFSKQRKIALTAQKFLMNDCYDDFQPRFDVVEIYHNGKGKCIKINHIENAFDTGDIL